MSGSHIDLSPLGLICVGFWEDVLKMRFTFLCFVKPQDTICYLTVSLSPSPNRKITRQLVLRTDHLEGDRAEKYKNMFLKLAFLASTFGKRQILIFSSFSALSHFR